MLPSLGHGLMPAMAAGLMLLTGDGLLTESGHRLVTQANAPLIPETTPATPAPKAADLGLVAEDGRILLTERPVPVLLAAGAGLDMACEDLTPLLVETA